MEATPQQSAPAQASEIQKIRIHRVDILKTYTIDTLQQSFACQFLLQVILPGLGHLAEKSKDGKKDDKKDGSKDDDKWPSGGFYIKNIEPQNLLEKDAWKLVDSKFYAREENKDDLLLHMRIEGTFFLEGLDLEPFPFDTQKIMIRMIYLVTEDNDHRDRRAKFEFDKDKCDKDSSRKLIWRGYMKPKHHWTLIGAESKEDAAESEKDAAESEEDAAGSNKDVELNIKTGAYGAANRSFPSFEISFEVRRSQVVHYTLSVALPAGVISGLSLVTLVFPIEDDYSRFKSSLSLMITMSAYQHVVRAQVPKIDVMTKLDTYILMNFFMLSLMALTNGLLPFGLKGDPKARFDMFDPMDEATPIANVVVLLLFGLAWVCVQTWWVVITVKHSKTS